MATTSSYKSWQVAVVLGGAFGLIVLVVIAGLLAPDRPPRPKPPEFGRIEDDSHKQAALRAVEAKHWVVSANWPGSVLTVEARGDGSRWDGYATTLCSVVREHTTQTVRIAIKDVNTGATIGTADCDW